jgi:Domain of unknown function (DUF4430)
VRAGHGAALFVALGAALSSAGCGLGAGSGVGSVGYSVTRDYGRSVVFDRRIDDVKESDTVIRLLDRNAEITTRYGGGFVQSIDGTAGGSKSGRYLDWFFYVNGVESPVGSADRTLEGGDRVWWDYRDWTAAMHVPAVVGSWPQPFAGGYDGRRHPVRVECRGGGGACALVRRRVGAAASGGEGERSGEPIRVLVGPWARLRTDPVAARIEDGPQTGGVFARFERRGSRFVLSALDVSGRPARQLGAGAGLVAATRRYDSAPLWLVTGTDAAGVRAAARLLGAAELRHRYAVATLRGSAIPLPLR